MGTQKKAVLLYVSEQWAALEGNALLMTTRGVPKSRMELRESQAVLQDRVPASGGPVVPRVPIMLFFTSERKREGNSGRGGREGGLVEPFPPSSGPWQSLRTRC